MMLRPALAAAALLLVPAVAAADETPPEAPGVTAQVRPSPYGIGARIGGYGFRRDGGHDFDECRMNGFGVFGERRFGSHFFVETGLDMYFSQEASDGDLPIDRVSGLVTAAAGLRMALLSRLDGYAQLGVGLEMTRVSVPYDDHRIEDRKALPLGFLGIGGDVRVGSRTHLGAVFRASLMGNFDYDPARLEMQEGWTEPPAASEVFDPSMGFAAQGQFYLRRDL